MELNILKLLQLEHNCRSSENIKELYYQIVNQTRTVVNYSQGILLTTDLTGKYKVVSISDIPAIDSTSPFIQWAESVVSDLVKNEKSNEIFVVNKNDISEINYKSINEYSPPNILFVPLKNIKEDIETNYIFLLSKEEIWQEKELEIFKHLSASLSYFLFAMRKTGFLNSLKKISFKNK